MRHSLSPPATTRAMRLDFSAGCVRGEYHFDEALWLWLRITFDTDFQNMGRIVKER